MLAQQSFSLINAAFLEMVLPCEMIDEILCRLCVKDLLRCRCVSKGWCSLIDSTAFVKKHLKRSIECNVDGGLIIGEDGKFYLADFKCSDGEDDDVAALELNDPLMSGASILGVANGLVCLLKGMDEMTEILFFNPSTRQVRKIPTFPAEFVRLPKMANSWGFGYDHVNDDLKVVKIGKCLLGCCWSMVFVYSMKTNSWTRLEDLSPAIFLTCRGLFASGALHWEAINVVSFTNNILVFDFETEQFTEVPFPAVDGISVKYDRQRLCNVGGSLCILDNCSSHMDVYLLTSYGAEKSLHKAISVGKTGTLGPLMSRPITFSKSGNVVLLEVDDEKLVWYDIEKKAVKKNVKVHGIPSKFYLHLYSESLLSTYRSHR